jgi:hypothetical protein
MVDLQHMDFKVLFFEKQIISREVFLLLMRFLAFPEVGLYDFVFLVVVLHLFALYLYKKSDSLFISKNANMYSAFQLS